MDNKIKELAKKYEISECFLDRYFKENAEANYTLKYKEFMFWKKGKFLNPQKKEEYYKQFLIEEIDNFYEKNELNLPRIEFALTTRCTLKCRDCANLMQCFTNKAHKDITLEEYKSNLDNLTENVNSIRRLILIGGEPLIHKDFAKIVEYSAKNNKVNFVEIITNGTIIPNKKLIDVCKKYSNKIYFYISNYEKNESLKLVLKNDLIKKLLKENNIKFVHILNLTWFKEESTLKKNNLSKEQIIKMFMNCDMRNCLSILDNKIHVCPKSSSGCQLGMVNISSDDVINLNEDDIREKLIEFYNRNYFEICEYCVKSREEVLPAIQVKKG